MKIKIQTREEIKFDIDRIAAILQFDIFKSENRNHPLMLSALTEILVRLRDLLWKSEKFAKRVSFQDDVIIRGKVTDVTDLVVFVRDAVCHINSNEHDHDQIKVRVSFNRDFWKRTSASLWSVEG